MLEELSQGGLMEGRGQEFKCYSSHSGEPLKDFKQGSHVVRVRAPPPQE